MCHAKFLSCYFCFKHENELALFANAKLNRFDKLKFIFTFPFLLYDIITHFFLLCQVFYLFLLPSKLTEFAILLKCYTINLE